MACSSYGQVCGECEHACTIGKQKGKIIIACEKLREIDPKNSIVELDDKCHFPESQFIKRTSPLKSCINGNNKNNNSTKPNGTTQKRKKPATKRISRRPNQTIPLSN